MTMNTFNSLGDDFRSLSKERLLIDGTENESIDISILNINSAVYNSPCSKIFENSLTSPQLEKKMKEIQRTKRNKELNIALADKIFFNQLKKKFLTQKNSITGEKCIIAPQNKTCFIKIKKKYQTKQNNNPNLKKVGNKKYFSQSFNFRKEEQNLIENIENMDLKYDLSENYKINFKNFECLRPFSHNLDLNIKERLKDLAQQQQEEDEKNELKKPDNLIQNKKELEELRRNYWELVIKIQLKKKFLKKMRKVIDKQKFGIEVKIFKISNENPIIDKFDRANYYNSEDFKTKINNWKEHLNRIIKDFEKVYCNFSFLY